uniref:Uncharacterized protein n=1 Tax=Glossina austeni TaxID=7395 RepID=A0A1A9UEA7_GLOAU
MCGCTRNSRNGMDFNLNCSYNKKLPLDCMQCIHICVIFFNKCLMDDCDLREEGKRNNSKTRHQVKHNYCIRNCYVRKLEDDRQMIIFAIRKELNSIPPSVVSLLLATVTGIPLIYRQHFDYHLKWYQITQNHIIS